LRNLLDNDNVDNVDRKKEAASMPTSENGDGKEIHKNRRNGPPIHEAPLMELIHGVCVVKPGNFF